MFRVDRVSNIFLMSICMLLSDSGAIHTRSFARPQISVTSSVSSSTTPSSCPNRPDFSCCILMSVSASSLLPPPHLHSDGYAISISSYDRPWRPPGFLQFLLVLLPRRFPPSFSPQSKRQQALPGQLAETELRLAGHLDLLQVDGETLGQLNRRLQRAGDVCERIVTSATTRAVSPNMR